MAEIHVERKRGLNGWVWFLVLALLIVAAVVYLWQAGYINLSMSTIDSSILAAITGAGGSHGA